MKYQLMFQNRWEQEKFIAEVETMKDAYDAIKNFLADYNYKFYYIRSWLTSLRDKNPNLITDEYIMEFDVGSWGEFFIIHFSNKLSAEQFCNTIKKE